MFNIQCNYCKRGYDCVNESRPGVTSEVLSPEQALAYTIRLKEKMQLVPKYYFQYVNNIDNISNLF